jgi:periplasmic divalent cation tolerance protein
MSDSFRLVYMTAGAVGEARRIADALVSERLAACVNILPGMQSVYRWQDAIQHDDEIVLIAKTTAALVDRLGDRVRELHSYECPCIVSLAIDGGNPAFLTWISEQTEEAL